MAAAFRWIRAPTAVRRSSSHRGDDLGEPSGARGRSAAGIRSNHIAVLKSPLGQVGDNPVGLNALQNIGIKPVGRMAGLRDGVALFSDSLANACAAADLKMDRRLTGFDTSAAVSERQHFMESLSCWCARKAPGLHA